MLAHLFHLCPFIRMHSILTQHVLSLSNKNIHKHPRLNSTSISWLVAHEDGVMRQVHSVNAVLTVPMTTRIIFRTNFRQGDPGFMEDHVFEISYFRFTSRDEYFET